MALGTNRDYKTTERRAKEQLAHHAEIMNILLGAIDANMTRAQASDAALRIMEGTTGCTEGFPYSQASKALQSIMRRFAADRWQPTENGGAKIHSFYSKWMRVTKDEIRFAAREHPEGR